MEALNLKHPECLLVLLDLISVKTLDAEAEAYVADKSCSMTSSVMKHASNAAMCNY